MEKLPQDYILGQQAYNENFNNDPQIPFDKLVHDYQMHWVRVARSVVETYKRMRKIEDLKGVFVVTENTKHEVDWKKPDTRNMGIPELRKWLDERVPKQKGGKRYKFMDLPDEQSDIARSVQQALQNRIWHEGKRK